jgi:hypothetical protein
MSSQYAMAAVSTVLRDLLNRALATLSPLGSSLETSLLPPDRVETLNGEGTRLNLFLYQAMPNSGWRNVGLPSHNTGFERMTNPPLALDLYYILTAYGAEPLFSEILLGCGMQALHETPVLSRPFIRRTLEGPALPPLEQALADAGLADQIELIKICPHTLNSEEMSKLWTAFQAKYRPSAAYHVSVVLIEGTRPAHTALPVLRQGPEDRGPVAVSAPFPSITRLHPARGELWPAVRLGEDLAILGEQLNDDIAIRVTHTRLQERLQRLPSGERSPTRLTLHIPGPAEEAESVSQWASGIYTLTLVIDRPDMPAWTTSQAAFALSPLITIARPDDLEGPLPVAPGDSVTLTCIPRIRDDQKVQTEVMVGMQRAAIEQISTPEDDPTAPSTVRFTVPELPGGEYAVRLRLEGVDSLPVTYTGSPPQFAFDDEQKVLVS